MLTKHQIKQLDILWQTILMERYSRNSILGGQADCAHHHIPKSRGMAFRWYLPNGVLVNTEQHNNIEDLTDKGKEYIEIILAIKGSQWLLDLQKRGVRATGGAKGVTFERVKAYFNGDIKDYIN